MADRSPRSTYSWLVVYSTDTLRPETVEASDLVTDTANSSYALTDSRGYVVWAAPLDVIGSVRRGPAVDEAAAAA